MSRIGTVIALYLANTATYKTIITIYCTDGMNGNLSVSSK
jgi:hypothetical protein